MRAMELDAEAPFKERQELRRNMAAFWLLGMLNNSSYVIMLAGANSISSAAVGLVYLCAILPSIAVKATAPFWFHKVSYSVRVVVAGVLMAVAYATVGASTSRGVQLAGVVAASLQGGLGEASCLALSSHYHAQAAITMWSSGTGFAGVFGYAWVALLHVVLGMSFRDTLAAAQCTVLAWLLSYFLVLEAPDARARQVRDLIVHDEALVGAAMSAMDGNASTASFENFRAAAAVETGATAASESGKGVRRAASDGPAVVLLPPVGANSPLSVPREYEGEDDAAVALLHEVSTASDGMRGRGGRGRAITRQGVSKLSRATRMTARERMAMTLSLWPYTVPLFTVYAAEYAMQAGAWTAIGFPVTDETARHQFYVYGNWAYQGGVFLSRSSGMLWQAGRRVLWAMPAVQLAFLAFFLVDAVAKFWYNWGLLSVCFVTGLLGGAVYVQTFTAVARDVEPQLREFSLGAASVADSAGILVADVAGIMIQGCLFKANGIKGADFKC